MKNLERRISLLCPLCGNDQFESLNPEWDDDINTPNDARFRCSDCNSVYTKEQLLAENAEKTDLAINEMKTEAMKEAEKELKKVLKKWK